MDSVKGDMKGVAVFVFLTYSMAYAIGLWMTLAGGPGSSTATFLLVLAMFIPLLAVIVTAKLVTHDKLESFGLSKGGSYTTFVRWSIPS